MMLRHSLVNFSSCVTIAGPGQHIFVCRMLRNLQKFSRKFACVCMEIVSRKWLVIVSAWRISLRAPTNYLSIAVAPVRARAQRRRREKERSMGAERGVLDFHLGDGGDPIF